MAWGQRVYLIDEYELPGFCAGIKQRGGRFQTRELHGLDYVKVGKRGELPPLSGEPRVPPRYQEFVRHGEIKATVVRVQGNGTLVKEQGVPRLKVGMRLCFDDFKNGPDRIVQSVRGQEAIVVAVGSAAHTTPVKPGALLTTGNYWKRPTGTGRK